MTTYSEILYTSYLIFKLNKNSNDSMSYIVIINYLLRNMDKDTKQTNETSNMEDLDDRTDLQKEKDLLKMFILGTAPQPKETQPAERKQINNFLIDKTLGEGTFGKVKLGIHTIT
jgi:hypothetical protein